MPDDGFEFENAVRTLMTDEDVLILDDVPESSRAAALRAAEIGDRFMREPSSNPFPRETI